MPPESHGILEEQPQQGQWNFENGMVVSSQFCSGNLGRCALKTDTEEVGFDLFMSGDGLPYTATGHYKSWFYFSITGVPKDSVVTFSVKNMALQSKLYKMGLRPVYRTSPHSMKWKRFNGQITWGMNEENTAFQVNWTHTFS